MVVQASALAELFGVSERRITQVAEEFPDKIVKVSHGKYDLFRSVKGFMEYQATKPVNGSTPAPGSDIGLDYEKQRARMTKGKADLIEMEVALREGRTHDAETIRTLWGGMVTNAKTKILAMPTVCAGAMDGMTIAEREAYLKEQCTDVCQELKDYDPAAFAGSKLFDDLPDFGDEEDEEEGEETEEEEGEE